ncbi:MAG: TIGR01459 family HAD-type hydrolase [Rickettsiaceae bacterium]|nr:TIGR01459 family HAD-type hydrolase [Rickettsiaceae bacterium]
MEYRSITKLTDLIDYYDAFFFDIWGVLHEGGALYHNCKEVFNQIAEKKSVRVISNAPRLAKTTIQSLVGQGLSIKEEHVITSGEIARLMMQNPKKYFESEGLNVYHIKEERHDEILENIDHSEASSPEEANLILFSAGRSIDQSDTDLIEIVKRISSLDTKILFTNPDKIVLHNGTLRRCAGHYAEIAKALGANVMYSGKPEELIFDVAIKTLESSVKKILMVGDTLYTDILGAHQIGIDSGLVLTGNMGILIKNSKEPDVLVAAEKICKKFGIMPTRIVSMD